MKKHRVTEGLREPMSALGFRYQASRFIADRDPYTLSVGINTASEQQGRVLALNPVLGVAHKGAVAWLAGATGRRDWLDRAIVSRPIGYVMPEDRFTQWRFTEDNLGEGAVAVADAVATHGLPWMEHMTDLDAMRIELATGFPTAWR